MCAKFRSGCSCNPHTHTHIRCFLVLRTIVLPEPKPRYLQWSAHLSAGLVWLPASHAGGHWFKSHWKEQNFVRIQTLYIQKIEFNVNRSILGGTAVAHKISRSLFWTSIFLNYDRMITLRIAHEISSLENFSSTKPHVQIPRLLKETIGFPFSKFVYAWTWEGRR